MEANNMSFEAFDQTRNSFHVIYDNIVVSLLVWWCTLVAYIANTDESDQPGITTGIIVVIALSVLRLTL